jgi:hypothetical protein
MHNRQELSTNPRIRKIHFRVTVMLIMQGDKTTGRFTKE